MANFFNYFLNEANVSNFRGNVRAIIINAKKIEEILEREDKELSDINLAEQQHMAELLKKSLDQMQNDARVFCDSYQALVNLCLVLEKFEMVDLNKIKEYEARLQKIRGPDQLIKQMDKIQMQNSQKLSEILRNLRSISGMNRY
jgi:hypothetical protein